MSALSQDRRQSERRVSPAVGEFAIQENARLRKVNVELLVALSNLALEGRHYFNTGGGGTYFIDSIDRANAAIIKAAA